MALTSALARFIRTSDLPRWERYMQLQPGQLKEFSPILQDAFGVDEFDEMLLYRMGIKRENIALGKNFATIILRVFNYFQDRHKTTDLVLAAREANHEHPGLLAFAQQFHLSPVTLVRRGNTLTPTANQRELESEIRKTNKKLNPAQWRKQLGQVEAQVCRIEIDNGATTSFGTGFLVGPDAVLTNYHVIRRLIGKKQIKPEEVALRFDYKVSEDGSSASDGTIYHLEEGEDEWLIDKSEYSPVDQLLDPMDQVPDAKLLDYALLRVSGSPGNDRVGGDQAAPSAPTRSWVKVTNKQYDFDPGSPLYIMQHPQAGPLVLLMDTDSIINVNGNGTRVRYRTNTERGSSGSPCFNQDWELVALHHSGDATFGELRKRNYNEGIPTSAIYALLEKNEKHSELGK